jgi:hypothetical protein
MPTSIFTCAWLGECIRPPNLDDPRSQCTRDATVATQNLAGSQLVYIELDQRRARSGTPTMLCSENIACTVRCALQSGFGSSIAGRAAVTHNSDQLAY